MSYPPLPQPTVLIVEDEWLIADMVSCTFEDAGFRVAGPAATVKDAMVCVDAGSIDVAILDVNLGPETSLDLAEDLVGRGMPVVLTTGYGRADLPDRFRAFPILGKPVAPHAILALVRQLLGRDV